MKLQFAFAVLLAAAAFRFSSLVNAQAIRVTMDLKVEKGSGNQRIDFQGKTNLPAGTVAWFRAAPKIGALQNRLRTPSNQIPWGAGSVKIPIEKDGTFKGRLKTSGAVKTGDYVCQIDIPIYTYNIRGSSRGQPDDIYEIIGYKGEHLTGPLVQRGASVLGSHCKIELKLEIDFRKTETAAIERREKRKYMELLNGFKQGHEALLSLRTKGVLADPSNQLSPKWNTALDRTATAVEFLVSQEAILHLRKIHHLLEKMHWAALDRHNPEFADAEKQYEAAILELEQFIDALK